MASLNISFADNLFQGRAEFRKAKFQIPPGPDKYHMKNGFYLNSKIELHFLLYSNTSQKYTATRKWQDFEIEILILFSQIYYKPIQ